MREFYVIRPVTLFKDVAIKHGINQLQLGHNIVETGNDRKLKKNVFYYYTQPIYVIL